MTAAAPQGAVSEAEVEAGAWHEAQIQNGHCGEENAEAAARRRANHHHEASATSIRTLKQEADHGRG